MLKKKTYQFSINNSIEYIFQKHNNSIINKKKITLDLSLKTSSA